MPQVGGDRHSCKNFRHLELDFLPSCLHTQFTQETCLGLWTLTNVTHTEILVVLVHSNFCLPLGCLEF